jgi:hypothetical protein
LLEFVDDSLFRPFKSPGFRDEWLVKPESSVQTSAAQVIPATLGTRLGRKNPRSIKHSEDIEAMKPKIMSGSYRNVWNSGTANDKMIASTGPEMYRNKTGMKTGIFQFFP